MTIGNPIFQSLGATPTILVPSTFLGSSPFFQNTLRNPCRESRESKCYRERRLVKRRGGIVVCWALFPVDPWAPSIDSQSIASQLFAFSLFPYLGFLYFITKSKSAPKLTLFGFYFLLAFVGATTKVHYGTSLSNVDWLHGGAESLLTLTNLFIVMGLREALKRARNAK
ncbi:uncharacterized protein LOC133854112 isoform X2 [Alnus glutinosa]|uniref:uncharacterized protein LOC133854112 isoform X2 n=1 Tax=Alnus glutinosa TaxID=3517 RepID=UPI002D78410C|nr:uncharacterized protein LOC133854112 isoform X2 [Alnus glutinosa]